MTTGKSFDYQQALGDPCRIFGEPGNVLSHPDLDATQKREILESWWQDAVRLSESEGESMGGGKASGVKKFKTRSLDRYLNRDEFSRLGEALAAAEAAGANAKFVTAVRLLALTGCRKSEITRLRWSEVDTAEGVLRLADTKTGPRSCPCRPAPPCF